VLRSMGPICVTTQNIVKIGQKVAEKNHNFRYSRLQLSAILDFPNINFL